MIRHLLHHEIDKAHWDRMLAACSHRQWYARSWVLDTASPHWNALVDLDRGALMPLTWRSRWGIRYLYQPFGLQQLGVFAPKPNPDLHDEFIRAIPPQYRYWDIYLNAAMVRSPLGSIQPCTQQELCISENYAVQRAAYSQGHRRNLRKAEGVGGDLTQAISAAEFAVLFARTTGARYKVPVHDQRMMEALIGQGLERGEMHLVGLREEGKVVAAACIVAYEGRSILLKSAVNARGQERHAMFQLIDHSIAKAAGTSVVFDFAGSNTPSVARFNAGFGAHSSVYLRLQRNALPVWLRWLK